MSERGLDFRSLSLNVVDSLGMDNRQYYTPLIIASNSKV